MKTTAVYLLLAAIPASLVAADGAHHIPTGGVDGFYGHSIDESGNPVATYLGNDLSQLPTSKPSKRSYFPLLDSAKFGKRSDHPSKRSFFPNFDFGDFKAKRSEDFEKRSFFSNFDFGTFKAKRSEDSGKRSFLSNFEFGNFKAKRGDSSSERSSLPIVNSARFGKLYAKRDEELNKRSFFPELESESADFKAKRGEEPTCDNAILDPNDELAAVKSLAAIFGTGEQFSTGSEHSAISRVSGSVIAFACNFRDTQTPTSPQFLHGMAAVDAQCESNHGGYSSQFEGKSRYGRTSSSNGFC